MLSKPVMRPPIHSPMYIVFPTDYTLGTQKNKLNNSVWKVLFLSTYIGTVNCGQFREWYFTEFYTFQII